MLLLRNKTHGFTIVELIVVVVVIGLLATAGFVAYTGVQAAARDKTVLSDLDTLDGIQTQYGIANNVAGKAWYSGNGIDADLQFTPSPGNVIDVVVSAGDYCIRGYNPSGNKNAIDNAYSKGSSEDACGILAASVAAGGSGDASLVGWWKLNGNALDSSGNNNNGAVSSATLTIGQNGQSNGAYSFNGTSSVINTGANYERPTAGFTIASWIKPSSVAYPTDQKIIATTQSGGYDLQIRHQTSACPSKLAFNVYVSGSYVQACSSVVPADNVWVHVLGVYNGSDIRLYVNGTLDTTVSAVGVMTYSATSTVPLCFSSDPDATTCPASSLTAGDIDDVRIYSRALSSDEVSTLYLAGAY